MSMSSKAGSVLVRYQGWAARRSSTSAGAVAVPCVPDDDQGVHEQGERDGALDGAGRGCGPRRRQDVAGVGERLLDAPRGGVPCHQGDRAGGQVGGDQGQVVAAGGALVAG
jgi:hypothetical protein